MNCLIVEDNADIRARLAQLARAAGDISIEGEYATTKEALRFLRRNAVDLLLLNIRMQGIGQIRKLKDQRPLIVFTSPGREHAAEAFELNATDCLVQPVGEDRFMRAMEKVRNLLEKRDPAAGRGGSAAGLSRAGASGTGHGDCIFIRDSAILRRLRLEDILFAEATGDYVKLHTREKNYSIHITFRTAEESLPATRFLRVHRSFIVALDKIDSLQDGGIFIGGRFVPVADTYRRALNQRIRVI